MDHLAAQLRAHGGFSSLLAFKPTGWTFSPGQAARSAPAAAAATPCSTRQQGAREQPLRRLPAPGGMTPFWRRECGGGGQAAEADTWTGGVLPDSAKCTTGSATGHACRGERIVARAHQERICVGAGDDRAVGMAGTVGRPSGCAVFVVKVASGCCMFHGRC